MKKLKIILLFSYLLISIYVIFSLKEEKIIKEEYAVIKGIITEYEQTDNYLKLVIKNKEKILGYYYGSDKYNLKLGDEVILKGAIKKPEGNRNFYLFNYKNYLKSKQIYKTINIDEITKINSKIPLVYIIKNIVLDRINSFKYTKNYMFLFLIGENNLEETLNNRYKKLGIIHLFAISGMHISFFKKILEKIFNKSKKKDIIIIIFLSLYLMIAKTSPSITRSVLTENIYLIIKKKISKKEILKFVFFFLLFINPFYILNIGFQLSFLISYTFTSIKINNKNKILNTFTTSIIAFIVSSPIIINQNFELNLLTPIYNLFFIPFVTIIVFPLTVITFILTPLEPVLVLVIQILENCTILFDSLQYGVIPFGYLNFLSFTILYLLIYLTLKRKKYVIFIIIFLILHYHKNNIFIENNLVVIDVGQGDSILLQGKENILIDTGGLKNKNISKETIIPIMKSRSIHTIDFLILTHGDYDHMGEAINLVENFKVKNIIFNCGEFNELEQELINILDKKKIPYYSCIKELNIDNNKLYFLQTKEYDNENDNSNVIYTELGGYRFMFMGDASITTEKDILNKYNLPDIDVLKVGHHGSRTSSSKEFINDINPKYSIISVGKKNRYGHPNKEVLDNLKDSKIYRTDQDGSIMFKIKNNKMQIESCSP